MTRTDRARKLLLVALTVAFLAVSGKGFYDHRHLQEPVVIGPGVTGVVKLAEYNPSLRGTANAGRGEGAMPGADERRW